MSAKPQVYEHCVVITFANTSVYIVDGLKIAIIRNYQISRGIARGVLHCLRPQCTHGEVLQNTNRFWAPKKAVCLALVQYQFLLDLTPTRFGELLGVLIESIRVVFLAVLVHSAGAICAGCLFDF